MKKLAIALALLQFTALSLWGQTGSALFQEGRDAFSDKLFSRAVESFREFIELYPSDPRVDQADYMIGVSFFYLKRFNESIRHFSSYENKYPQSAYLKRIHYWKGISYYADGIYRSAINEFQKQTSFDKEIYFLQKSYQFLGYCYEKIDEPDSAVLAYQKLIDLNPDKAITAQALERQGIIFLNQESYERALTIFTKLTLDFRDVPQLIREVPFYMGESYYQLGEEDKSIQNFENFLSLYTDSDNREKAIYRLGSLYAMSQNPDSAKEYMNLLNNEYPDSEYAMEAHLILAESYLKSGDFKTARLSLNKLLESETDPVEIQKIQYNLARSWEEEPPQALKWYLMAAKGLDPDLAAESLYQSGIIYENSGDSERTILLFERLFNQFKENIHRELVGEWMAVYYDTNAQDLVLKNHLDRMLTEYPESEKIILYLYMRGNIAYREGDYNGSLRFYQNILNIEEEDLTLLNETRYRIGYIYTLRKEFSRAKSYFDGILEESEKNELYYRALLSSGICSLNIRETGEAAALFNRVIQGDSSKVWTGDAYFYLGKIAMDEGNYYRASDNFSLAVKVSTTSARRAESLYQLGWSQLRLTLFEDAAGSFDTLAADYPDHKLAGESLYRAGIALSYMEEWKASLERFIPALKMIEYASLREELLYQIAWSHFMLEDFPRAMEYLSELQNEFPDSPLPPDGLYRAAEALQERGSTEAAVFSYKQVFDLFPDSPLAETSLFRALSFSEDFRDSLKLMQEYLISFPSVEKAHLIARQIDYRIRQKALTQQEGELIQEILSLPLENSVRAVIQLAQYYGELDSREIFSKLDELEALEGLREEDFKKITLYRGIARFKQGESEKAAPLFESLLDDLYADTAAEAQFNLALILIDQDKWKEAADAFLRIRYRYPGQNEWISRGLYEASLAYMKAADFESFNRTAEMLQREYPDSEWNRILPGKKDPEKDEASEPEPESPEADPDALSPSDDLLPIIEAE